jgi:hypothetical protein
MYKKDTRRFDCKTAGFILKVFGQAFFKRLVGGRGKSPRFARCKFASQILLRSPPRPRSAERGILYPFQAPEGVNFVCKANKRGGTTSGVPPLFFK